VEFYSKNKFEKLVHLVAFIITTFAFYFILFLTCCIEYGFIITYPNGNVLFQTPEEGCASKAVLKKSLPDCCHYYLVTILMGIKS